jgi:hypothetical protein
LLSVVATDRLGRLGCKPVPAHQAMDLLEIDSHPAVAQFGPMAIFAS